jgi:hypothetical protein
MNKLESENEMRRRIGKLLTVFGTKGDMRKEFVIWYAAYVRSKDFRRMSAKNQKESVRHYATMLSFFE